MSDKGEKIHDLNELGKLKNKILQPETTQNKKQETKKITKKKAGQRQPNSKKIKEYKEWPPKSEHREWPPKSPNYFREKENNTRKSKAEEMALLEKMYYGPLTEEEQVYYDAHESTLDDLYEKEFYPKIAKTNKVKEREVENKKEIKTTHEELSSKELLSLFNTSRKSYAAAFERYHKQDKKNKKYVFSFPSMRRKAESEKDFSERENLENMQKEYFELRKVYFNKQIQEKRNELIVSGVDPERQKIEMSKFADNYADEFIKEEDEKIDALRWESIPKKDRTMLEKMKRAYDTASPLKKKLIAFTMTATLGAAGAVTAGAAFGVGAASIAGIVAAKTGIRGATALSGAGLGKLVDLFDLKKNRLSKEEKEKKSLRDRYKNSAAGVHSSEFQEAMIDLREKQNKRARKNLIMKSGLAFGFGTLSIIDLPDIIEKKFDLFSSKEIESVTLDEVTIRPKVDIEVSGQAGVVGGVSGSSSEAAVGLESYSVTASSRGAIATIEDLQSHYSEENMPDVLRGNAKDIAQRTGLYNPDSVEESSMLLKGDTLELDADGDLRLVHANGSVDELINFDNKVDIDASSQKYSGRFFDYDGVKESTTPTQWEGLDSSVSNNSGETTQWEGLEGSMEDTSGDEMQWEGVNQAGSMEDSDTLQGNTERVVERGVDDGGEMQWEGLGNTSEATNDTSSNSWEGLNKESTVPANDLEATSASKDTLSIHSKKEFIDQTGYSNFEGISNSKIEYFQEDYKDFVQELFGERDVFGAKVDGFTTKEWKQVKDLPVKDLFKGEYSSTEWFKKLQLRAFSSSYINENSGMRFSDALGDMIKQSYV